MYSEYLQDKFGEIEDPRHPSYTEHKPADILIIVMGAVLCGTDRLGGIAEFAAGRAEFFRDCFGTEQLPSKPTFSWILNMTECEAVAGVVIEVMKEKSDMAGDIIAVDGKAIRSTSKAGEPHSALQILTAYMTESSAVIGQKAIHGKTNEISVFQAMLDILEVKGKIITASAMHCQGVGSGDAKSALVGSRWLTLALKYR